MYLLIPPIHVVVGGSRQCLHKLYRAIEMFGHIVCVRFKYGRSTMEFPSMLCEVKILKKKSTLCRLDLHRNGDANVFGHGQRSVRHVSVGTVESEQIL